MSDIEVVAGGPTAGTFTFTAHWDGNVGVSDPVPYNYKDGEANAALAQAFERAGMPG